MIPSVQYEELAAAARPAREEWHRIALEAGERGVAAALLVVLAPALVAVAAVIHALSRRAPLIAHRRVGRWGGELWVWKFRTMWGPGGARSRGLVEYIEDEDGPALKSRRDRRVSSRFARFCRRHSIDELPQLFNVVRGEMSLVGPRPMTRRELRQIFGPTAAEVLRVKPGLTGLWQVSGRNRLSIKQRRRLDLALAGRQPLKLYLNILARTIPELLGGHNTW